MKLIQRFFLFLLIFVTLFMLVGSVMPDGTRFKAYADAAWAFVLTPENLLAVVAVVFSLLFNYFPPLSKWYYNKLSTDAQRMYMILLIAVCTAVIFGLACAGLLSGVSCTKAGAQEIIGAFVMALVIQQGVDRITPPSAIRREAKKADALSG